MTAKDSGGPVYPFEYHNQTSVHQPGFFDTGMLSPGASQQFAGISLRDYFAAKAMQAIFENRDCDLEGYDEIPKHAYLLADAMLAERAK